MTVRYSSKFIKKTKKLNVRIYHKLRQQLLIFSQNSQDPVLRNHELQGEWKGYRSIDITADYRALYREISETGEVIAYFSYIGTHKELYGW